MFRHGYPPRFLKQLCLIPAYTFSTQLPLHTDGAISTSFSTVDGYHVFKQVSMLPAIKWCGDIITLPDRGGHTSHPWLEVGVGRPIPLRSCVSTYCPIGPVVFDIGEVTWYNRLCPGRRPAIY